MMPQIAQILVVSIGAAIKPEMFLLKSLKLRNLQVLTGI